MVLLTPTSNLIGKYRRNCKFKGNYTLFRAVITCIRKYFLKNIKLSIYKCPFKDHYHIGNKTKKSIKRKNYCKKRAKLTLYYYGYKNYD